MTFDTPETISAYRLLMLASKLKLETKGLKCRGESAYSIIKREFDLKGSKQKVLSQFDCILIDAGLKQG